MRIAILGTRGIPARYGGFETFAEELGQRLASRGHQVTVYCRQRLAQTRYLGVKLRYLPTVRHKYFDTVTHTCLSTLDLLFHRQDVALYCNAANAIFTWMPRLAGMPTALNVDGLERRRRKWNVLARGWYRLSEWLSTFCPAVAVSDARHIADYYQQQYGKPTRFIPYGAETGAVASQEILLRLGLEAGRYFLYVSRLEPENNALLVREAFERVRTDLKLALVGDAPYAREYIARVRATRDPRVVIPGAIYGQGYRELQSHCRAYIHATEVGGTHPALIEAMGRGALTLFLDTPENREVAGGAGIPFEHHNLAERLEQVLVMSAAERDEWRRRALERVREHYAWERVADAYEELLTGLTKKEH
ncbi:MAG: glycosyltransferase family 1 protein [Acidobacteria bacterium]|nr:glycosyltransferase family 1 protein [Acidobacteriota bacterium]